jgi:hypothetical protein
MAMVHTLTARPTDTEVTRTGIPATGIGRIPATTTTTGGKRLSPALKALGFSTCSTTSVPAGDACRDWAFRRWSACRSMLLGEEANSHLFLLDRA